MDSPGDYTEATVPLTWVIADVRNMRPFVVAPEDSEWIILELYPDGRVRWRNRLRKEWENG